MKKKKTQPPAKIEKAPNYLTRTDNADLGINSIKPEDVVIPRLKIVQSTSRTARKTNKELEEGMFYNHVTFESYGNKLNMFVLLFWDSTVWFTDDFKMMGSKRVDLASGRTIFTGDEDFCGTHEGNDSFNYMIILEKELIKALKTKTLPFPMIYSLMSSARAPGKQLNSKMWMNATTKGYPIYAQLITATTTTKEFGKGEAFIPQFSFGRFASEEEFSFLKKFHQKCKKMQGSFKEDEVETNKRAAKASSDDYEDPEESDMLNDDDDLGF